MAIDTDTMGFKPTMIEELRNNVKFMQHAQEVGTFSHFVDNHDESP